MNLLVYALIVVVLAGCAIWISNESGLNARARGIPNIVIGLLAVIALVSQLV